jgi:hypothetical protein
MTNTITVYGQPVAITEETILATRQWYVDNAKACIHEALRYVRSGGKEGFFVNNIHRYIHAKRASIRDTIKGRSDHTLAFAQRAVYIQTGQDVPLLQ